MALATLSETHTFPDFGSGLPRGDFVEFDIGERRQEHSTLYNPSIPFYDNYDGEPRRIQMVRHQGLYSPGSEILVVDYNTKALIESAPVFSDSEDPYYLGRFLDSKGEAWNVLGMVKTEFGKDGKVTLWYDALFRYKNSIRELSIHGREPIPWMIGIHGWKDTRALQLPGAILVTPRPQGEHFGGNGSIARFFTKNLDTFPKDLERFAANQDPDTIVKGVLKKGSWGAINQLLGYIPGTQTMQALGHDACYGDDGKKYYASTYIQFGLGGRESLGRSMIIGTADHFADLEPRPGHNLGKVVFMSGIVSCDDGTGRYVIHKGVADRAVGRIILPRLPW